MLSPFQSTLYFQVSALPTSPKLITRLNGTVAKAKVSAPAFTVGATFPTRTVWVSVSLPPGAWLGFAAVGAMVNSEQEAQQASFPVMMPLILSAVLMQVVLRNPEGTAAKAVAWFPLTAPVIMPMRMALVDVGPLETALVIGGLALTVLGAVWLAARVYRVGLLMYGKRPSVGELARWVARAG